MATKIRKTKFGVYHYTTPKAWKKIQQTGLRRTRNPVILKGAYTMIDKDDSTFRDVGSTVRLKLFPKAESNIKLAWTDSEYPSGALYGQGSTVFNKLWKSVVTDLEPDMKTNEFREKLTEDANFRKRFIAVLPKKTNHL